MARQVGEVFHDGAVDEAGAAGPAVFGLRIRDHRHVVEEGAVLRRPLLRELVHVEVLRPPAAPVERHRPHDLLVDRVLDDGLDRCEAGARGDEDDGLFRTLAQEEGPERRLEAQDVLLLHLAEDVVGELPAGDVAHVDLDQFGIVRRVAHREAAARAITQQELEVLAGEELQLFTRRELELQHDHVVGELLQAVHAAGQGLHLDVAGLADHARFERAVGQGRGLAEQRLAVFALGGRQRLFLVLAVVDRAGDDRPLARAAGAVFAAVGNHQAGTDGGRQDGFVVFGRESLAARGEG